MNNSRTVMEKSLGNIKLVWVVKLSKGRETDTKYVRAFTELGAIKTAKYHSRLPNSADAYARLANPIELGCVRIAQDRL